LSETWPSRTYEVLETNTVGPSVGQNLKKQAIIATVIAFVAIITYIGFRFNFLFGVAATFATFHDVLAMLGIFCVLGRELNILFITALLTIAGYSLTDTIVVFDRIREHMAKMKVREDFDNVINRSINEVLSRTIVTNLTTFLVTVALALLGGSVLFDFALALMIGTVVGTYSSIFVASPLLFMWKRRIVGRRPSPESGGSAKRSPYEISQA
jgi:preprotein translocase SecF subunit